MVNGIKATLRIDLNMLRDDRIVTCRDFLVDPFAVALPVLEEGDLVRVVEPEGDAYIATVESVGGENDLLVELRLNLDSLETPTVFSFDEDALISPQAWLDLKGEKDQFTQLV